MVETVEKPGPDQDQGDEVKGWIVSDQIYLLEAPKGANCVVYVGPTRARSRAKEGPHCPSDGQRGP